MGKRTWDTEKARELLDSGMEVEKVAKAVETAIVNLKNWMKNNYAAKKCPAALPADVSHIVGDDTDLQREKGGATGPGWVQMTIVEPKEAWDARRLESLMSGIRFQLEQKKTIPAEWVAEFNQLVGGEDHEQLR